VVVGAGPCGGTLALLLARAGWAVTLVEAAASGAPRPYRGEGLMPSGLAVLKAMGLWPLPASVRHRPLRGWAVVLERRPFFQAAEPLAGDQGCWLVDQESLLAHLRMELLREKGGRVLEGQAVRGLCTKGARRRVTGVVLADGREVAADLVVACDGRHSALRRQAGLVLQGEAGQDSQRERVLWFRLAGAAVAPLERWLAGRFLTVVGDGVSFALFAEAAGDALRLGWVAEGGVAVPSDGAGWRECWAAALPEEVAGLLQDLPVSAIDGPQSFPVRVGWAPHWHVPGLLLLGDAAHPMSPVRAQGINMALRDALVAARQLGPLADRASGWMATSVGSPLEGAGGEGTGAAMHAELDALLPGIARRRLPEIRRLQALQAREMGMGARLRQQGWLRRGLAATAPWSGVLARQRWIQQQHRLRQGVPEALALSK
jgi:2-polyprenyl-6-methoxyphenol hydroxylase-like FAD-dependent oxidoreductase